MRVLEDFGHRDRTLMHRRPGETWCSQVGGPAIERSDCEIREFARAPAGIGVAQLSSSPTRKECDEAVAVAAFERKEAIVCVPWFRGRE